MKKHNDSGRERSMTLENNEDSVFKTVAEFVPLCPETVEDMTDATETSEEAVEQLETDILEDRQRKRRHLLREVAETTVYCTIVVVLTMLIKAFVIQPIIVDGISMRDTLQDNDIVLLEKVSYWFSGPERYDIIVFQPYENTESYYVKRVIGIPGDVLYIDEEGRIHIADGYSEGIYENDRILEENYGREATSRANVQCGTKENPAILGEGEYYVLGDNRNNSHDSRAWDIGKVHEEQIQGKVVCRLFPIKAFGIVD